MTSRALRIGVLIRDQLVEERIFDGATPVTFGQSLRCALSIPIEGAPRDHVLFARDAGRWVLRPAPQMTGRVGQRGTIDTVTATEDTAQDVPIEPGARGKLVLGDATILFQEVAARPKAPRPRLPASVRGTFADRIDRRLAVIVGGSLAVHVGIAAWAWATDRPAPSMLESPVATYQQETIDMVMPDLRPTPPPTAITQPGLANPVSPTQTPRPIVAPTHISLPTHASNPVDAPHLASLLTGNEGEVGVGGMNHHQVGVDLAKQLDEIRRTGGHVTIGDSGHTSRSDDSVHIDDHRHDLGIGDPTLSELPAHHEEDRPIRIKPFDVKPDLSTTLSPESVIERIGTVYMAGLKRCYRKALVADATLRGKIALTFSVDERGHVADPQAAGITPDVDACIASQMTTWHFSTPKDRSGNPTEVRFQAALALQPD